MILHGQKIRILNLISIGTAILVETGLIYLCYYPDALIALLWLLLFLTLFPLSFVLIIVLINNYFERKTIAIKVKKNYLTGISLALTIIVIIIHLNYTSDICNYLRDKEFNKNFSEYENIVNKFKGEIVGQNESKEIHESLKPPVNIPAYEILLSNSVQNNDKYAVEVRFYSFGNIPVLRGGYMYVSDDNINNNHKSLRFRKIKPHWYAYSE